MTVRNVLLGAVAAATAVVLTACGAQDTPAANGDGKIKVVASTNVWGSVVEAVGGDAVQVSAIISDPSGDPHSYESKPSDLAAVRDAKLVIFNGGGYDDFFAKLLGPETEAARKIEAFPISGKASGHDEPEASAEPDGHAEGEEEHDHSVNEHVWYDFETVRKVADQAAVDLGAIAPDKKSTFEANAKAFTDGVQALEDKVKGRGAGKKVLATEAVAHYLLDAAGVADATPEAFGEAVENETDVPAAALAEVLTLVEGKQVAAVVNNAQTGNAATGKVLDTARSAGVVVVEVTETLPEGATGYLEWMTKQVDALVGALGA
ncbi:zinc/manganese transport system substrate-binding protein [Saccharothrix saharensis]|uniref:Zinc/manganese transport system substrate-binding protein n=1 Tax=Saccharothrix saharensis TaxID=571190 RepID=A0A543JFC7_9PSEU|nr:zinc ABC transporter substrate-binding protein [Saccharothrix saharensis]TQM81553.1 zinc/manganese transport system substrate-binding protein [Saccharothrix saharensis]